MTRRQAKKCVTRHCCDGRRRYPWPTWQRVLQTLGRHHLAFWGRGDWRSSAPSPPPVSTDKPWRVLRFLRTVDARVTAHRVREDQP
jgi:hypothetical protein